MDETKKDQECPECGGQLIPDGEYASKCESCGKYYYKGEDSNEEPE